ncbi:MAG: DUF4236 domain-containing protein [Actinobacteria bacterium]|nr:DUF4236 domain-containing protein [Actinomycetota bacterium]
MGMRVHRSIQIVPGLRLNMSKSGLGLSTGFKGYHVSRSPGGRTRRTISIPGTGLSWIDYSGSGTSKSRPRTSAGSRPAPPTPPSAPPPPGLLAPHDEKALYKAFTHGDLATIRTLAANSKTHQLPAATIAAVTELQAGDLQAAQQFLQQIYDLGVDPATDPFLVKYTHLTITLEIMPGATITTPVDRTAVALSLGEFAQAAGAIDHAAELIGALDRTTVTALALADLYDHAGQFDSVVTLTENAPNTDDTSSLLWVLRGVAFRELGHPDAALQCFAKVIRCTSRNPVVLHRARLERARCYEAQGNTSMARKDLERIMAEDSTYDGLSEALAALDK